MTRSRIALLRTVARCHREHRVHRAVEARDIVSFFPPSIVEIAVITRGLFLLTAPRVVALSEIAVLAAGLVAPLGFFLQVPPRRSPFQSV